MRIEVLLGIHRVWDVVDPGLDDAKKNNIVKGAGRVKDARLQTLITKFKNMKMSDNDTIDAYAAKLSGIASKSATLGEVISEHKLVKKFLTSLPRHFVHIVAYLEQVLDLKTTGFEDVVGRLKAYEERVKQKDKANNSQENCFMLGRIIPTGIVTQAEGEDVDRTLKAVVEVVVKDVGCKREHISYLGASARGYRIKQGKTLYFEKHGHSLGFENDLVLYDFSSDTNLSHPQNRTAAE
ncbi:hypothetical protein Tco_0226526 [Tanacetum coccineum]